MDDMRHKCSQESKHAASQTGDRQQRIVRRATLKAECAGLFQFSGSLCSEFQSTDSAGNGGSKPLVIVERKRSRRLDSKSRNSFTSRFARWLGFAVGFLASRFNGFTYSDARDKSVPNQCF